jgi:hypothetical protein
VTTTTSKAVNKLLTRAVMCFIRLQQCYKQVDNFKTSCLVSFHQPYRTSVHFSPEQGGKLLGLLLTGSTGQHMAGRNGLA